MNYGSDVVIEFLARAGIEYVALNPGASFRGLHDSLVNAPCPKPVVVLHEEIAIGIAHGYAKSAGKPMAAFIHDLVGLQHASMAIFNAFVDNVPMLIIGGSGPRDSSRRRPWIDWVHTGHPQGALVRDFVKWDAEPASIEDIPPTLARALRIALTAPMGPVYVSIDAALQEEPLDGRALSFPILAPPAPVVAPMDVVQSVADALIAASRPVIVVDRPGPGASEPLRALVERLAPAVIDLGSRCTFPSNHWADQTAAQAETLAEADLVLALEARDLAWAITKLDLRTRQTKLLTPPGARVISVGLTETQHTGFLSREALVPGAEYVISDVTAFLKALLSVLNAGDPSAVEARRGELQARHARQRESARRQAAEAAADRPVHPLYLASALWDAVRDGPWQLANGVLKDYPRRLWDFEDESSYLGRSGGEGLGYGLPASLGAALARSGDDTLVIDIQPDGDLLYTPGALWTAAHHRLPLLIVVYNNRTYGKDELHQTEIAHARGRSLDKVPIGIHIDHPAVDFAGLARAQGVEGFGPVDDPAALPGLLKQAAQIVRRERRPVLVDVICGR